MAKRTLLNMVQNILNAMDSDEVNSIGDTVESLQVAEVVRETYDYVIENTIIPGQARLIKLDSNTDPLRPNVMTVPTDVAKIEWIRYNNEPVEYVEPEVFVHRLTARQNDDNVITVDGIYVLTNKQPQFFTSFDDNEVFFDSYDVEVDSCLQQSKTLCWGQASLEFLLEDDFIPLLPTDMFPRLLSEAKATCFINYKQVANSKEEQRARQQKVANQNNRHKVGEKRPIDRLPDYARRGARGRISRSAS